MIEELINPLLIIVLLGLGTTMFIWSIRLFVKRRSGNWSRRSTLPVLCLGTVATGIMLWVYFTSPGMHLGSLLLCIPMLLITVRSAWVMYRPMSQGEAIQNFSQNSALCGQCSYNLTGNTSGICPECGWVIPVGELLVEDPDFAAWWRKWSISYLRDTTWHLSSYIGLSLIFLALSVYFYLDGNWMPSILSLPLAAHLAINAVRVTIYIRRRKCSGSSPAGALNGVSDSSCGSPNSWHERG